LTDLIHEYKKVVIVPILLAIVFIAILGATKLYTPPAQADLLVVPLDQLSREAELIILGHVMDEKNMWESSVGAAFENHTVSVEKVLKGSYNGSSVGVITESQMIKDSPNFKRIEQVILFLYKKPLFVDKPSGNDYTLVLYSQGKYEVTDSGLVDEIDIVSNITLADFENKITDALSNPKTNNTLVSKDADLYHKDADTIFSNDSDTTPDFIT
jgi:hypothetical protein